MNKQQLIAALEAKIDRSPFSGHDYGMNLGLKEAISLVNQLSEPAGSHECSACSDDKPTSEASSARWQPIEIAPKDGREILWCSKDGVQCVISWDLYSACFEEHGSSWMPLPPAPSPEQKG